MVQAQVLAFLSSLQASTRVSNRVSNRVRVARVREEQNKRKMAEMLYSEKIQKVS